jgi:hypothetical protein
MAQEVSNVEPEAFACALHFFLGLLQKQVPRNVSKSSSSSDLKGLSTPTPISAFIRSVLDPMASSASAVSLAGPQKSPSGSVPITMALSRLMTKVRRVQYADSNGSKKVSRISLFPQKFNDYRLLFLPLKALSVCLQNQDPSDRIGALRILLGLTALHPLHADQIGSTEQIMSFLFLSVKKMLSSEDRNASHPRSYSTSAQELQFVQGHSEAEDACILRLLTALSFRRTSTRQEICRSLTLHSVFQQILQRICSSSKTDPRPTENFSLPQMVTFWSISSPLPLKTPEDPVDRFILSELTLALLDLTCSLSSDTIYCESESITNSLMALDKLVLSCFTTLIENFRSPSGGRNTTQILDLKNCVIVMENLSNLKSYLADGISESEGKDTEMAVLFFKTERSDEESVDVLSLVWKGLLLRTPPRQSDITGSSPINVFEDIFPFFRDLSAAIKFPLEIKNDHDLKAEHGRISRNGTFESKRKNVPHLNIAKGGNVLNLIAELGQGDFTPRLSSHLEKLLGLGSNILNDWSVSWPSLPPLVISTKIAYMLQVARTSGGSVKAFLGFLLNGAERDDTGHNRTVGRDSGNLLVAQRLSHSLAAILTGGRVTIYVPIEVLRSIESDDVRSFDGDEDYLSNSSCSSDNFDADFVTSDYDSQDPRQGSRHGVKTGDLSPRLSPRTSGWGAGNIFPRSIGNAASSRGNTGTGRGGRPSSVKMHRRTLYATKIVEQTYTAEVLRCSRALQSVTYLLTDVMSEISRMTVEAITAPPVEAVTDRVFDYTPVTRFLLSLLCSTPRVEEEGSGLVMCLASLECLISLCLCNVNKVDSTLPGASAHYSNNKASTSLVHSAVIANIHLIASQLERLGMRVLGPSLRLLIAVSSSLKLTVLKEETCCAALVRLVVAGLRSQLRSENADSAAAESCGLIIAMGRWHPDTVVAILSRNEVESSLLDLIQDLVKKRSIVAIAPSANQKDLHNRDLHCLCCALEAMVVLTDCYNPSPYFIFDPSWSLLSSDRRLIHRPKENGLAGGGCENLRACAFTGAQAVVQVLYGQPAVRKLESLSTEMIMLLLYCYNAASSLLQLQIRIQSEESCEHITSLRGDLIPALLPLLPLALEPAFHPVFKPQKPSDSLNSINLQPALHLRAEEGASLLVGSAMHFISALLQCDKAILSNLKIRDPCDQPCSRKPLSLYELFSALEIPSWAVGKPFRHLFSQRVPTFEEWSGVTRATTSSGNSSSGHSLVVSGTGTPSPLKQEDKFLRDVQRAGSMLQLVLHLMDAPTASEREDLYGSTDSFRQLNANIGWARDNEFVQLRGMELLSHLALGGVDFCESAILPRQDSQTLNIAALTSALRSNSITDSDGELTPRRRSTLKSGPHGFKRTFPVMGSEKSHGGTPIPRALSALCLALTAGSSSTQSSRHKEEAGPLSLTARGARLRRAFVIALKAIVQTSEGVGCDVIVQSEAHKWLFLFLRAEAEVAPRPPPKTRRSSVGGHAALELFRLIGQEDCSSALGYGEEPLHSPSCTPALCCQVVALLASAGFSNSLCLSGMCEAVLSLMAAHSHILRIQLEGLIALVEMLTGAPEHLPRLNAHTGTSNSIFEEEPSNRNPFASKSPSVPPSARSIAQHAADTISDALDSLEESVTDATVTDVTVEDRKKHLRLLLSRHKKLGLDQESCSIS